MDSYEENGEWSIDETSASRHEFSFDSSPEEKFANIVFNIHLRRRYTRRLAEDAGLNALTIRVPWCQAGDTALSPKKYRDAGRFIADALIEKRK